MRPESFGKSKTYLRKWQITAKVGLVSNVTGQGLAKGQLYQSTKYIEKEKTKRSQPPSTKMFSRV